jgi:hypothetical protein
MFGGGFFEKVIRTWGWSPHQLDHSPHQRWHKRACIFLLLCADRMKRERQRGQGPSQDISVDRALILDFPTSRKVRNKCCLSQQSLVYLVQQPKLSKTELKSLGELNTMKAISSVLPPSSELLIYWLWRQAGHCKCYVTPNSSMGKQPS